VTRQTCDVAVIGAGIIGLSIAFSLTEAGKTVTIIERGEMAMQASYGNAGALAFSDIVPMASPGIIGQAIKWLADPLGPLSIPPAYLPRIAPWLLRLWRASLADRYAASVEAQVALMGLAQQETEPLLARAGQADAIRSEGVLHLYETEAEFQASLPKWRLREEHGIALRHVQGDALAELQPGLAPCLTRGTFVPGWKNVNDPYEVACGIGRAALAAGARLVQAQAQSLLAREDGVSVVLADGTQVQARHAVLAGGAWSHRLARTVGDKIPLETERGYNTTLPAGAFDLKRQLTFGGHGFVISPLACGLRVGGAVELGGLERAPDYRRAQTMLAKAKRFLPGLDTEGGKQWMGFRPSLPDTLPVIGPSPRAARIIYAFGHGHLGLTQSAATARLVRDIVLQRQSPIPLEPYRPGRFAHQGL